MHHVGHELNKNLTDFIDLETIDEADRAVNNVRAGALYIADMLQAKLQRLPTSLSDDYMIQAGGGKFKNKNFKPQVVQIHINYKELIHRMISYGHSVVANPMPVAEIIQNVRTMPKLPSLEGYGLALEEINMNMITHTVI